MTVGQSGLSGNAERKGRIEDFKNLTNNEKVLYIARKRCSLSYEEWYGQPPTDLGSREASITMIDEIKQGKEISQQMDYQMYLKWFEDELRHSQRIAEAALQKNAMEAITAALKERTIDVPPPSTQSR